MSKILFRNEAAQSFLLLDMVKISKYGIRHNINWEETQIIGRMDPIRNFKNTEAILEVQFNVKAPDIHYIGPTPDSGFTEYDSDIINLVSQLEWEGFYKFVYPELKKGERIAGSSKRIHQHGSIVQRFFYPSYEKYDNTYYMKSAPLFRASISEDLFDGYCVLQSFDLVGEGARYGDGVFSDYDITLNLHVVHETVGQVSSRVFEKNAKQTVSQITGNKNE